MNKKDKSGLRQIDVPEGKSGDWEVVRFRINKIDAQFNNIREYIHSGHRFIKAGTYTRLTKCGNIIMSDTPAEIRDFSKPVRIARQSYRSESRCVLINGLSLGVMLQEILDDNTIEHLTVIENSPDVIKLVATHWKTRYRDRLTIICDDAFNWKPPKRKDTVSSGMIFGMILHPTICRKCTDYTVNMVVDVIGKVVGVGGNVSKQGVNKYVLLQ